MNHFCSLEDLKQYRDSPAISQSFLKQVLANNTKKFKETLPLILGSYLDSLLTTPDLTDDLFQVGLSKRPSETIKEILDEIFEQALVEHEELSPKFISSDIEVWKDSILIKCREKDYQRKWGDDALWNSILKEKSYWEELVTSQGKMLITPKEKELSDNLAQLVCSSHITGKYFLENEVDKYYQKPLYWKYQDFDCKGLLDILIFEEDTKTIYIIDLKSTSANRLEDWFQICRTKNYPFQMSWYYLGVLQNYSNLIDEGWTVKCRWLVVPASKFRPWIVPCTEKMLFGGRLGYKISGKLYTFQDNEELVYSHHSIKQIEGYEDALQRLYFAEQAGLSDYDTEHYLREGKLTNADSEHYFFT